MKLFSGSANPFLAEHIAVELSVHVSPTDIHVFPDGERRVRLSESVVGENVVLIQSIASPVDSNYMELFFTIDGAKRSGAESITAVIPYFGYQRQDHVFRDGEAVSLEVVVKILESLGITKMISIDMHTPKIPDLFSVPVAHLSALSLFAKKIQELGWDKEDCVLVSPDMGGIRRIKALSEMLGGMSFAAIEKNRDLESGVVVSTGFGEGSVAGKKRAIVVDDMVSSGKTLVSAGEVLKQAGIEKMITFATHPIFAEDAPEILEKSLFEKVFVTDTVVVPQEKQFPKLTIMSVASLIAHELKNPTQTNYPLL
ncbi:MAG TPA: ribose-phosphate pyrophosphokinase [Patescibacteria group bacterium]|nr:ribose-phosphate pyrophosphokinase [Patescibacteria group bacterium]